MRQARTFTSLTSLFTLTVVLASSTAAIAQDGTPSGEQTDRSLRFDQQIVVTPARSESLLDREPAAVTVIDEADIVDSPAGDIPEVLRQAGVHVTDIAGNRRSYRVDLRGFGATASLNTLVLVDGRRVNAPDLSGTDWAQIPLSRVRRIEIIPGGTGAVMFGDNAAGGVINIITQDGRQTGTELKLRAGSFSTLTPEVATRGAVGAVSYAASGRYHRSDGHRRNSETEGGDIGGQLSFRGSGPLGLGVSAGYHGDTTGFPGGLTESDLAVGVSRGDSLNPDDFAEVDDAYVMVTPRANLGARGYALVDISLRQRDASFFSSFTGGTFTGATGTKTVGVSPSVVLRASGGGLAHHLVLGGDLTNGTQDVRNTLVFAGTPDVGVFALEKQDRAVYLRDETSIGRVTIAAGYRYNSAAYTFEPSTPSSRNFSAHAASVGGTVQASNGAIVFAHVSRSFRYPVLDELFNFFTNTIETGITPQRSIDVEGGVRLLLAGARANISFFRLTTRDEIFFNPISGFGVGANENLDGASRRTGFDLAVSMPLGPLSVGGTYRLTDTSIDGGLFDGSAMPGVARHRGSLQLDVPLARPLTLGLDASFVGPRLFEGDFEGRFGELEGYALVDARLTYRQGSTRVFLDLKNLLDEQYTDFGVLGGFLLQRSFYPSPGRHALVGFEVGF
jgi:iron complex outermembrane receptor protein